MRIGNWTFFERNKVHEAVNKEVKPNGKETAYSYSMLYGMLGFEQYNPDDLVGLKGIKVYKRIAKDEQIKVVSRFRRNAVTGRGWTFIFDDDVNLGDDEKEQRIKIFEKIVSDMPGSFRRKLNGIMSSMRYGFSLTEKTFEAIDIDGTPYWGIKNLRTKPVDTFRFKRDSYGNLKKLIQDIDGRENTLNIKNFIHHVHNPEEDEYYGQSELKEAYRSWWSKDVLIKLWNIYLERMAGGFVWITPKNDSDGVQRNSTQETDLLNMLTNMQTKSGYLLPRGYEMNVQMPNSTDAFEKAVDKHDLAIAKSLLMPDKLGFSSTGDNGSRALGDTQLEAFLWLLDAEAADLEETLNEQLFNELGEYNFGDGLYPRFKFKPLSQSMRRQIADTWGNLVQKGAVEATDTDEEFFRDMFDLPEKGEPLKKSQPNPMPPGQQNPGNPQDPNAPPPENDPGQPTAQPNKIVGETVVGSGYDAIEYSKAVFTRAMRRVDFAKIDNSSEVAIRQGVVGLSDQMETLMFWLTDQVRNGIMGQPEGAAKLKIPANITSGIRKVGNEFLANGWDIGVNHGKREIEKAGLKQMSAEKFSRFTSLGTRAADYLKSRSFVMAGKLTADVLAKFQEIIANGIKFDKSTDQVIDDVYQSFSDNGLIERDVLETLLADALITDNPNARLETTVRTLTFESINEARFDFFTSDSMGGFVTALEYSAILDSRTTDVCLELDGKVYLARSHEWDIYRPPNHFNCRSLLIPVTTRDEVAITNKAPAVDPQKGFYKKEDA